MVTQSGKHLKNLADLHGNLLETYLINDPELMLRYQKSKELAVDLKLSQPGRQTKRTRGKD
jgi:hypothetical protein